MHVATNMLAAEQASGHTVRWAMLTLVTIVLLFLSFVVCVLLVRAMRRHRERLLRKRSAPTEYVDAWSMHKLPEHTELENADPDDADPDRPEGPEQ